jgi:hypothetical protein
MASPITNKQLKSITEIIREWPLKYKLTWEAICDASEVIIGYRPTRQAFANKPLLINAYKTRKSEIKAKQNALSGVARPKSIPSAMEQILKLRQENERLKKELSLMAETAQRFIHNASLHGLTRAQLMKPLPDIGRKE